MALIVKTSFGIKDKSLFDKSSSLLLLLLAWRKNTVNSDMLLWFYKLLMNFFKNRFFLDYLFSNYNKNLFDYIFWKLLLLKIMST